MTVVATYRVDKALYHAAETKHDISLVTTEYKHRNELLVHLQIGKNFGIRLNKRLGYLLPKGTGIQNEQFLFKKTYNQGNSKPITRSTFDEKLSRFDMSQTVIEREVLEDYAYSDKNGLPDHVQIVIREKAETMSATIDFKDTEQYANFSCPAWLARPE